MSEPDTNDHNPRCKKLAGLRFGRLQIIKQVGARNRRSLWLCECECGNVIERTSNDLVHGRVKSCGCLKAEVIASGAAKTHGLREAPIYGVYHAMRSRCENQNSKRFADYGGRGITVCDRWKESIQNFVDDMGEQPTSATVERIDNNKGYSPDNCRWATRTEQGRNKRNNRVIEYDGKHLTLSEWAERTGIKRATIQRRLDNLKWSTHLALTVYPQQKSADA